MTRRSGSRVGVLAVGALLTVVGVGACTSSGGGSSASSAKAGANRYAADAGGKIAVGQGAAAATSAAASAPAAAPGSKNATTVGELTLTSAKIRTVTMTVSIKHGESVAAKADAADAIAIRTGGSVDTDDRTTGKQASARLVLRIPPADLTAVLGELSKLGVEKSRQLNTEDVTSRVADVSSRVTSARVSIARLRALYEHATKVTDVITIEGELAGRESDLEALEAQQRALGAQTATASVTLSLLSQAAVAKPATTHHHRSGFVGGLENGWDAFSSAAGWAATAVGAVLPFVLLLLVIGLAGRLLWPRLRPARHPVPAGPAAE